MTVEWTKQEEEEFISCCLNKILDYKALKLIELRVRTGSGTEDLIHLNSPCCGDATGCLHALENDKHKTRKLYHMKKQEDDSLGEVLDSIICPLGLTEVIIPAVEKASVVLNNVLARAEKENERPTEAEIIQIKREVLKESLVHSVIKRVNEIMLGYQSRDAREGGLLATPAGYHAGPLDALRNETLSDLMTTGAAVQDGFVGEQIRGKVLSELEYMEFDGQFRESRDMFGTRETEKGRRTCWIQSHQLDREMHAGLKKLCNQLAALPFELNKKVSGVLCQVNHRFLLEVVVDGGVYAKHRDGGYGNNSNNGNKFTVLYFPNAKPWKKGGELVIHPPMSEDEVSSELPSKHRATTISDDHLSENVVVSTPVQAVTSPADGERVRINTSSKKSRTDPELIEPCGERLVILKSRDIPYEILPAHSKRFCVVFYIPGPITVDDRL